MRLRSADFRSALKAVAAAGVVLLSACVSTTSAPPAAPSPGPALWVVADEDTTLYLFGTIHVLRPQTDWRAPHVEAALAEADALWLELDDVDDQVAAAALIRRYGVAAEGPALSSLLTPEDQARLDAAAADLGIPAAAFEAFRPWLAGVQISMAAAVRAGYDPASGVDTRLKAEADARGLPVRGLETMEQQFRFFHDLSPETQLQFLRQSLDDYAEAEAMMDRMVALWAAGDIDGFEALVVDDMREQWGALYDVLLVRRNADWADQIQAMLDQDGTAFIAVGAAHLAGDDSVQAQLRGRGLTVQRR